jgi:endonuclease/exonuclease/phosphatase family metal-dependent hydrolase
MNAVPVFLPSVSPSANGTGPEATPTARQSEELLSETAKTPMSKIQLKVLSWNLHGLAWPLSKDPGGRMDRVSAKVRDLSPDIVLLQEVWLGSHVDRLVLPLQPDWTPIVMKRRSSRPVGGLLTLIKSSAGWRALSAPEFHAFAASAPIWRIWEGDGLGGKGVLAVDLERGGQHIIAVNTHLQSQYSGNDYSEVREAQLFELREVVFNCHATIPAIVAGDFNTESRESLYSHIAALGTDLTAEARQVSNCGTTANPRDGRPEWIDYIVSANLEAWTVSADLELVANHSADVPYSDHSGLFCTVRLTPRE